MDQELVLRARDGDPGAFRSLAVQSHPRLFSAAFGILRDRHLAEDATQRALVDVWRHIGGLRVVAGGRQDHRRWRWTR